MKWTKELDDLLLSRWSDGMHMNAIAVLLGTTKSAVHTRLSRLKSFPQTEAAKRNISLARCSIESRQSVVTQQGPGPKPDSSISNAEPSNPKDGATFAPISFVDARSNQCKFPLWPDVRSPSVFQKIVCGSPSISGRSWCEACNRRVYVSAVEYRARNPFNGPPLYVKKGF